MKVMKHMKVLIGRSFEKQDFMPFMSFMLKALSRKGMSVGPR
jgi:hypothetical protein